MSSRTRILYLTGFLIFTLIYAVNYDYNGNSSNTSGTLICPSKHGVGAFKVNVPADVAADLSVRCDWIDIDAEQIQIAYGDDDPVYTLTFNRTTNLFD